MWCLLAVLFADSAQVVRVPVAPAETLQVATLGTGDPVVLLPGLFGSAFAYRRIVGPLAAMGFQAVVIEPLGIGFSARPARADYSLTAQADRVGAAMDRLGVQGAVVVAHSVSASIALRLAYRRPDLVRAVVSLDGGPAEAAATDSFRRALRLAPLLRLFGGRRRIERAIERNLGAVSGDASWVTEEVVRGYTAGASADLDATLRVFTRMGASREPERLDARLSRIRCPVRILVGGAPHQGGVAPAEIAMLASRLPIFAADTVSDVGHYIHEERPETVVAAVRLLATR